MAGKKDAKEGKKLCLLLVGEDEEGGEGAVTFAGTLHRREGKWVMVREEGGVVPLADEWLERMAPVPPEARGWLLEADLSLTIEVGPLGGKSQPPDWATLEVEIPGKKGGPH